MSNGELTYCYLTERKNLLVDGTCHDYARNHAILEGHQETVSMNNYNAERYN